MGKLIDFEKERLDRLARSGRVRETGPDMSMSVGGGCKIIFPYRYQPDLRWLVRKLRDIADRIEKDANKQDEPF